MGCWRGADKRVHVLRLIYIRETEVTPVGEKFPSKWHSSGEFCKDSKFDSARPIVSPDLLNAPPSVPFPRRERSGDTGQGRKWCMYGRIVLTTEMGVTSRVTRSEAPVSDKYSETRGP